MSERDIRLILNGKKAGLPQVRGAVEHVRTLGHRVDVRVTWEHGHAAQFAGEAMADGVDVVVAGGGDGTVNEVLNGMMAATDQPQTAMAVAPLGSANDFAHGCDLPVTNTTRCLEIAATAPIAPIDVVKVNDVHFLNAAIAGFGAEVTFNTSERLKKLIGGGAYGITGFLTFLKQTAYRGTVRTEEGERESLFVFAAVVNGRQAGGFTISPEGRLDDGLLGMLAVPDFTPADLPSILADMQGKGRKGLKFVQYANVSWLEFESEQDIPVSPDGEHLIGREFRFDLLPARLPFVLPGGTPLLGG